jgi:cysteine synthase A
LSRDDVIVTICTDAIDRYHSVMAQMTAQYGAMDAVEATVRAQAIFLGQKTDWVQEGTRDNRSRWHNLKYYTWVEQQGKTIQELDAQRDPAYWEAQQARVGEVDQLIREARG